MQQNTGDPALPSRARASHGAPNGSPPSASPAIAWQPIATAPKDGRFVLLHVPEGLESGEVTVGAYWKADERAESGRFKPGNWDGWLGMDVDISSSWCEPTHWMPLPIVPAQGIVTGTDETRSGSAEQSEVEPDGGADAPKENDHG